jgi:hypothetical protein
MADGGKHFFMKTVRLVTYYLVSHNVVGKYGIAKYGDDDEFP